MPRGITQDNVDAAVEALLLAGERPTVERVRQHLGTGSPNTVTRMLDVWWRALGARLQGGKRTLELPQAPEPVAELASRFWEEALAAARDHAVTELAGEREGLAAARRQAESGVAAANAALGAARTSEAEATSALAAARAQLEDRQQLVQGQAAQIEDLVRQRDQALLQVKAEAAEVETLRKDLASLRAEVEAARDERTAHLQAVENRAHSEVDRARQERSDLKKQLASDRKTHQARIRELETTLTEARTSAVQATRDLAAEQARRETLEAQLTELRRSLEAAIAKPHVTPPTRTRTNAKHRGSKNPTGAGAKTSK